MGIKQPQITDPSFLLTVSGYDDE